jgi:hypothetical protein
MRRANVKGGYSMKAKIRRPQSILQPGQIVEFWENVLAQRDANDPRWLKTYSKPFRFAAEAYEKNRNSVDGLRAAA